jgi:hypothetical protein
VCNGRKSISCAKTSLPTYIGNPQDRKAPVSQIQAQVGNTQKVIFPILYQGLALRHQQNCRTAVLQHYEICPTPLLDVTQSLRIAASFASDGADREAFVFVLGVPNLSGAITASAEAGIQVVRLSSVCPPAAVRPHIQEGYLLGEYPEMTGYDQKQHYAHWEIDFGRRLIAKFRFNPQTFWKNDAFPKVTRSALYPDRDDPLFRFSRSVKN